MLQFDYSLENPGDHVMALTQSRFWQREKSCRQDWCFRQNHIAELSANVVNNAVGLGLARINIEIRAINPVVFFQNLPQLSHLIYVSATLPMTLDFLQSDDIRTVNFLGNSFQIETTIFAKSKLYIIGDDSH